ncbi:hypothetical protein OZL92_14750 [Bacillus sonorensis]|uniref:Transmembrane protein YczF n=2 Tax=Bacillus sonorensis TaxID=119858 RepID=M5P3I2_9BACI|nr:MULTISPECIES: hypothetical protein [Bacillus]ASB91063.1 hypothetical protein S101395_04575 [Bacillus sonorensis]EME73979.1 transmembrane protein YczF [Bacillus sonorensis L12]MBG9913436.1 transmembrane protein YczF [Bacillus sonorensis]MCF7619855.1 hypothetical protein [Bacillus sonorensis]MCY7858296.1 hypothetical protein [Bacillus sonorensis]
MKVIGIGVLLFICLMGMSVMLDFFQGMSLYEAVINNLSFNILEIGEWLMILLYISIVFAEALGDLKRKKKKRT